MKYFNFFRTANKAASISTLISLIALFAKVIFLNPITSATAQIYDLGVVVDAILTSVIASYIFYLFAVHLKEVQDKELIAPFFNKRMNFVIDYCEAQLREISRESGIHLTLEDLTEESLRGALKRIDGNSAAPIKEWGSNQSLNWYEYFYHYIKKSKESIAVIFVNIDQLDVIQVSILTEIYDCNHFLVFPAVVKSGVFDNDLTKQTGSFLNYFNRCRDLKSQMKKI
jgi:hypothetical protein